MKTGWLAAALLVAGAHGALAKTCDVKTMGAKGDGVTKDTEAIQKAIDTCTVVTLSGGKFLSGPLEIKSGVTLDVETGAMLLGSTDRADYKAATLMRQPTVLPFLHIVNADNVKITGGGTIDGQGKVWWDYVKGAKDAGVLGNDHPRPMGLLIDHSKHVTVENITIQNAGFWQVVPYYSDYLVFSHLRVLAPQRGAPNTDGIDPFSSSHIKIDHYFSSVGDDNIAIKSGAINSPGPDAPSEDIVITDCIFESGHGLSIGSEIAGGVHHVHAERISFKGTDQGIRVKANRDRGNDTSDLTFKDITMDDVRTSILISEYYPKAMPEGEVASAPITRLTPHFHDIHIENVKSVNSDWAGVIVGLPESPVTDISLKNVSIQAKKGMQIGYANVTLDGVTISSADGNPITKGAAAEISGK
ncbi:glycoside hydrolase family 28 protein [Granulicella tundricola]|uniref:Glycoside hydrolase family 28 n=1 Tax=Granulicella tundricola (strain ATCC BAA-1859 / DSM 23138 / MP5ACTX9) TaxID=1198114 RepID=E8X245_GRATM|nr:glycosyl hydrolase family 28 protein [Granulicella tundricola]ADW70288.1 glycoside hydrolase family 28 [Granulicella tundricola MP5ACTX9]